MPTTLTRWIAGGFLATLVLATGCNSCEQTPELPAPVAQEGRLPRPPEPATSPQAAEIPPPACAVVAGAEEEEGAAPFEVTFNAEGMCTDADGVFAWDFGDGSAATQNQNPVHTYDKPGSYTARVTLVDAEHDARDADELVITVNAP